MAVHASHAALPYPIKNARFSILLPYLDADGDPTAPTTPDTEFSGDNGAAADCAEEASPTSGMDGMALITLTGAETNYSCVALNAKVASGPKATLATLYPRCLATVGTGTLSAGSAGGGTLGTLLSYDVTGCFIKTTGGTGGGGTGGANNQVRRILTYNTSTGAFTVGPNWETTPSTDTTYEVLLPEGVTLGMLKTLNPTTAGNTLNIASNVLTLERLVVASTTTNEPAVKLTGNGTAAGLQAIGGATGAGIKAEGGGTSGDGIHITTTNGHGINSAPTGSAKHGAFFTGGSTGTSHGISAVGGSAGGHGLNATASAASSHGVNASGSAAGTYGIQASGVGAGLRAAGTGAGASPGIQAAGNGTGAGIAATGGAASGGTAGGPGISATGGAATTTGGGTSAAGILVTGGAGAASTNGAANGATFTAGGTTTVSGGSGIAATGTGNLHGVILTGAGTGSGLRADTISTSGTVTFNALTVSAATTLTGAVTASHASNNITGVVATSVTNNVNAVLANTAHGGSSATLRLGTSGATPAFYVTSSGGAAVQFESSASAGLFVVSTAADSHAFACEAQGLTGGSGASFLSNAAYGLSLDGPSAALLAQTIIGSLSGSVGSVATNGITAGSFAAGAIDASAFAASAASEIATAIEAEFANDATGEDLKQQIAEKIIENLPDIDDLSLTAISAAVWDRLTSALTTNGSIGKLLVDRIDAAISSRMATFTLPTNFSALGINASGHVSRVTLTDTLTTYTGNTPQTGDSYARLGAPAGASVSADIAAAKADTTASRAVTDKLDDTLEDNGGTFRFTAAALAEAPSGGGGGGDATAANQITIISHLTDIKGGSWEADTDTLVAISDAIAAIDVGSGSGANTVTITVTDGTDPLEGAKIRVTQGAESYLATTDADGEAVLLLDNATWSVAITKPGYQFTPTTLLVNGDETAEYELSLVNIPASDGPDQVTGYCYLFNQNGTAESGAVVSIRMMEPPDGDGFSYDFAVRTATSDGSGLVSFTNLFKGATYRIWRGSTDRNRTNVTIPADADDPFPLPPFTGSP